MINLKMNGDKFKILNLSDIQLTSNEWKPGHCNREIVDNTVNTLIEKIRPDLITLSGDIAWADELEAYEKLADFIDGFGIPWAPIWGNHDNQSGEEITDIHVKTVTARKNCIYERGPAELGNGNYVITIERDGNPVSALIMMDSHDCRLPLPHEEGVDKIWDELLPGQFTWYREHVKKLRAMGYVSSAIIMHIPIYAYRDAFSAASSGLEQTSVLPRDSYGSALWNEDYKDTFGVNYEEICSHPYNNGFFDLVLELDHTKCIISGHDHINNSCINYKGVRLAYALKTGPGCYWDPILNGGTVLTVDADASMELHHEYVDAADFKRT